MTIDKNLYDYFTDVILVNENPCKIMVRNITKIGDDISITDIEENYKLDKIYYDSSISQSLLIISQILEKSSKLEYQYSSDNFFKSLFFDKEKRFKKFITQVTKDFNPDYILTAGKFADIVNIKIHQLDELSNITIFARKDKLILKNSEENCLEFYIDFQNFLVVNILP